MAQNDSAEVRQVDRVGASEFVKEFYLAKVELKTGWVSVVGPPDLDIRRRTIIMEVIERKSLARATLFMDVAEATELWTAIGTAIRAASGKDPV